MIFLLVACVITQLTVSAYGFNIPSSQSFIHFETGTNNRYMEPTASATGDNWNVREVGDDVCKAGSRHFAGRINITDEKSMFFWFFEARDYPDNKPVTIWLNGGPGASSLAGLFGEIGPCTILPTNDGTEFNPFSWSNHTNLLFIDQPAGVGLSTIANETQYPSSLDEASRDFMALLKVFYESIFPQFAQNPLYIAGESFGGQYVPRFAADIIRTQKENSSSSISPQTQIQGIILVNAEVDMHWLSIGHYELFCTTNYQRILHFNESVCEAMSAAIPECERLTYACETTLDPYICEATTIYCMENLDVYFQEEIDAHRHSPYDLRRDCPQPPLCGVGDSEMGSTANYLNQYHIQKQLGFNHPIPYQSINFDLNMKWSKQKAIHVPTTRYLTYLLDNGFGRDELSSTQPTIPVLVMNGEFDVMVNVPGTLLEYDRLPWHGQAAYRSVQSLTPWFWTDKKGIRHQGGDWKGTPRGKRGLNYVSIYDAGHMSPADQAAASAAIFGAWINNGGILNKKLVKKELE